MNGLSNAIISFKLLSNWIDENLKGYDKELKQLDKLIERLEKAKKSTT